MWNLKTSYGLGGSGRCSPTWPRVLNDGREVIANSYMWVHRSGEFYTERPIVLYEYQKTRHRIHPQEFYKDYT